MAMHEVSFDSHNGRDTVQGWIYTPVRSPRGIVQVVHGFGEHSRRYLHLVLRLLDEGFVVAADDHVGHGLTAQLSDTWGDYGSGGYATTTEDEKSLHDIVVERFPGLPFFMFGHSWGSMIARDFAAEHGDLLSGVVLCGTSGLRENTVELRGRLGALVAEGHAQDVRPELVGELLEGFTARYPTLRSPNDWIALDPDVVRDHGADPFNNFTKAPTVQALHDFTSLWIDVHSREWAQRVPTGVPVYVIAGDQDPVGNYGEGPYQAANWLAETGHPVTTRLYTGYRHEIHNEPDLRAEVEDGIAAFLTAQL